MNKEGWGYLEAYNLYNKPPLTSHYFIPAPTMGEEWEEEDGWLPICGQHYSSDFWDEYGIIIESSDRPKCKKCLKAFRKRARKMKRPTPYQIWWMEKLEKGLSLYLHANLHYYLSDTTIKIDRRSVCAVWGQHWIKEPAGESGSLIITPAGRLALEE